MDSSDPKALLIKLLDRRLRLQAQMRRQALLWLDGLKLMALQKRAADAGVATQTWRME